MASGPASSPNSEDHPMSRRTRPESEFLSAGIEKLRPLLKANGFRYEPGTDGSSSGGSFATGSFRRGDLEIGLIVRNQRELGCPNYSVGDGYAGHEDLLWALGRDGGALVPSSFFTYAARGDGDSFDALEVDLRDVILPALRDSELEFGKAVARARERRREPPRGGSG